MSTKEDMIIITTNVTIPVSAHAHWSEDSEGREPHLPPGHPAPGRPLHLQRGQRVRQTGNSQGTVTISRK